MTVDALWGWSLLLWDLLLIFNGKPPEGGHWDPKWVYFLHASRAGGPNWHGSSSALLCNFQCSWAWNGKVRATCLSSRGVNPTFWAAICCIWPARTLNWVIFYVLESLQYIKIIAREMGQKYCGWRDMQINVPFPLGSTHLGYRCTTCAFSPVIMYAGWLVKSEHMLK